MLIRPPTRSPPRPQVTVSDDDIVGLCKVASKLCRLSKWAEALHFCDGVRRRNPHVLDLLAYGTAIGACARGGLWWLALDWLVSLGQSGIQMNVVPATSTVSACAVAVKWQKALELCFWLRRKGPAPNAVTCCATASACSRGSLWRLGLDIIEELLRVDGVQADIGVFNAAITARAGSKSWTSSLELMQSAKDRGIQPQFVTYSAVITTCDSCYEWRPALALLKHSTARLWIADQVLVHNPAAATCLNAGQWPKVLQLVDEMHWRRVFLDVVTLNTLLDAYDIGGLWEAALALLGGVQNWPEGRGPDAASFGAAISACASAAEWEQALAIFVSLSPQRRSTVSFGAVLRSMALASFWDGALRFLEDARQSHHEPDALALADVVNACFAARSLKPVAGLIELAAELATHSLDAEHKAEHHWKPNSRR